MCKSDDGLIIPSLGADAHCSVGSVILYLVSLAWCFLGVALIADIFMAAIETITSKETISKLEVRKEVGSAEMVEREFTVKVWNDTVANLTLMALGSSAPEILLSVIEVLSNDFFSGELGPSTIVGSAAFNLFIILAVCVMAIPENETRTICDFPVFAITAVGSVFAYLWLAFILVGNTPDIVDVEEGVITFLYFPVLVVIAYTADAKIWCFATSERPLSSKLLEVRGPDGQPLSTEEVARLAKTVRDKYGAALDVEKNADLLAKEAARVQKRSRAFYRVQATRKITGGKKIRTKSEEQDAAPAAEEVFISLDSLKTDVNPIEKKISVFKLDTLELDVGNEDSFEITVLAEGAGPAKVSLVMASCLTSTNVCSEGGLPCIPSTNPVLVEFEAGESRKTVAIPLSEELKKASPFSVVLQEPSGGGQILEEAGACLVFYEEDSEYPGMLAFKEDRIRVSEGDGYAVLTVVRKHGHAGAVTCKWNTKDGTAVAPSDFTAASGTLEFGPGESEKEIKIEIIDDDTYELEEHFFVEIQEAEGCTFDPTTDGFEDKCIAMITIEDDDELTSWIDELLPFLDIDPDKVALSASAYGAQFSEALSVNGGDDDEEVTKLDWVLHIFSVPWKLLFATVPPCRCCGGWLTFGIALMFIGLLTAVIGDLASLMGAAMGLEDSVTAITFVALGTSLPDTFASKTAATQDPYADAAIGNVTGSNAVNVFLGLGLPWLIASIYWGSFASEDDKAKWASKYCGANPTSVDSALDACGGSVGFAVPAGNLGVSVGVFCVCAVLCLSTIVYRRKKYDAELGGPMKARYATAAWFCTLWSVYVGVSTYLVYK